MAAHPADHPGPVRARRRPRRAGARTRRRPPPLDGAAPARRRPARARRRSGTVAAGAVRGPARADRPDRVGGASRRPPITVAFALVKGDRPELVVQKLTELGVDRIMPFRAGRSVVRWDDARAGQGGGAAPRGGAGGGPAVPSAVAARGHRDRRLRRLVSGEGVAIADRDGRPAEPRPPRGAGRAGGRLGARGAEPRPTVAGTPSVAIGAHVLRAETAAVTVGAILTGLRAGLLGEVSSR